MPSNSYTEKIKRAVSQLQNVEILIATPPKKIYIKKKDDIKDIQNDIEQLVKKIQSKLSALH